MTTQSNLIGTGTPAPRALAFMGVTKIGLSTNGAAQGSLATLSDFEVYTSGTAANGPTLPANGQQVNLADTFIKVNHSGAAMNVWPPVGGTIQGAAANAAISVPSGKTAIFYNIGGGNWGAIISA